MTLDERMSLVLDAIAHPDVARGARTLVSEGRASWQPHAVDSLVLVRTSDEQELLEVWCDPFDFSLTDQFWREVE
jgi:hypothetical protein